MVNRTVEMTEGDILIGEHSVRDREPAQLRREIGYVIQQVGLFPHRTIAENIATVPQLLGWDRERRRARTDRSPIRMSPEVISTVRLTIRIAVVLPHPEGPTSTQISPAGASRVRSSTAATSERP
jgi:ABC-type ATPase involved in cell division